MAEQNEGGDDISPHVHVKIGREKKRHWLKHADEYYRGNLSTLVVEAVDNTLDDKWVFASEEESDETMPDIELEPLEKDINELRAQTSTILGKLDGLAAGDVNGEIGGIRELDEGELQKLANHIHDNIPMVSQTVELPQLGQTVLSEERNRPKQTGLAEDLSQYLERHIYHIREAANYLERNDENVQSIIDEHGNRQWYILKPEPEDGDDLDTGFATADETDRRGDG